MTYLMVNLNDAADCRQAIDQLRDRLQHECGPGGKRRGRRGEHAGPPRPHESADGPELERRPRRPPPPRPTEAPVEGGEFAPEAGPPPRRRPGRGEFAGDEPLHDLPLPKKLQRIAQRGVFRHLHRIASEVSTPMSLPELDRQLGFQPNKMRSLKAIMAKLEHRFDLQFLVPDPEGSVDENSNPRYVMPQRIRNQILRVAA
jgi:hypothetical protein